MRCSWMDASFPAVLEVTDTPRTDLSDGLRDLLADEGAIVLRGLGLTSPAAFAAWAAEWLRQPMAYADGHSPRTEIARHAYTSTDAPADRMIQLHNEMSYAPRWPRYVLFWCETPPQRGGATLLCENRAVLEALPAAWVAPLLERQVTYVRTYGTGVGISLERAFPGATRAEIDAWCRERGIETRSNADGTFQTRYTASAVVDHPDSREAVWFNQVHAFHPAILPGETRSMLERTVGLDRFPSNVTYGDGRTIPDEIALGIADAYRRLSVQRPWQRHDVMLVDNLRVAHGRAPYEGQRRILAAFGPAIERSHKLTPWKP